MSELWYITVPVLVLMLGLILGDVFDRIATREEPADDHQ